MVTRDADAVREQQRTVAVALLPLGKGRVHSVDVCPHVENFNGGSLHGVARSSEHRQGELAGRVTHAHRVGGLVDQVV